MPEETLMQRTLRLLHESEKSLPDIAFELRLRDSDITFYWLRKFSSGKVADPSVNRVEELYHYLTDQPLLAEKRQLTA